ncbi:HAD family hydrolase [Polynucleobacter sp. MWH-UH24A]|uniref:D-glycero-alpha-D-manno-heptose-1,7-bisphosphate 7-phosphatase n=1 Tax=Polynucleobacter sp. MWH-UH24A TaxID=2689110 RepID=UPI001BFE2E62|nr:HAD family hydrolase [Polynucleobacter sp. MWH-UH24A]QWD76418.1 HAD family hydrolase [Polynucleobacter sp. MWH-UH24A]
MKRAVFLDRDGVINRAIVRDGKPYPPASLLDMEILPGVYEALQKLHNANYLLIVVTNQPDVARGIAKKQDIELMHAYLSSKLPIDVFKTCYHDNKDRCICRKPLPGALLEAAQQYDINLPTSFMVGDRWRDIEAGASAGCKTFFIDYNYAEKKPNKPDFIVSSLLDVKKMILGKV